MPLTKDLVSDYGADPADDDGDDAQAFRDANAAGRAASGLVTITAPNGTYGIYSGSGGENGFAQGIPQFLFAGTSMAGTVIDVSAGFWLGCGDAIYHGQGVPAHDTRLERSFFETAFPGQDFIQLITPSEYTRWVVGAPALITVTDLQGPGQPPNAHREHWCIITESLNTGKVSFTPPLPFLAKDTWPNYVPGGDNTVGFNACAGGPGTIYTVDPRWLQTVEYRDCTMYMNGQIKAEAYSMTLTRVKFSNSFGCIPSQNQFIGFYSCDCSNNAIEVDKLNGEVVYNDTPVDTLGFQSSSTNSLTIENGSYVRALLGTPKRTIITDSQVDELSLGCYAYGCSESLLLTNAVVGSIVIRGVEDKGPDNAGVNHNPDLIMSGGIIRQTIGGYPVPWAVPGAHCFWWNENGRHMGIFKILDVWRDDTYTYIQTDQTGGFPVYDLAAGKLYIRCHPCPNLTDTDGSVFYNHPAGQPFASYFKNATAYTYATIGSPGSNGPYTGTLWGWLRKLTVDVAVASNHSGSLAFCPFGGFDNYPSILPDKTTYNSTARVNLKTAGTRVVEWDINGNRTVTNAKAGDSLAIPYMWMTDGLGIGADTDISANSSDPVQVTVEYITDQGIVNRTFACNFS